MSPHADMWAAMMPICVGPAHIIRKVELLAVKWGPRYGAKLANERGGGDNVGSHHTVLLHFCHNNFLSHVLQGVLMRFGHSMCSCEDIADM